MKIRELKRWLPKPEQILKQQSLSYLTPYLRKPHLWQFNRRTLNKAVYIGVFCAFLPLPGQMFIALLMCLYFRANVPMAVTLTWITNPVSTIPICYVAYWIGTLIDKQPLITFDNIRDIISSSKDWLFSGGKNPLVVFKDIVSLPTFIVGMSILAVSCSILAGITFNLTWRYKTTKAWQQRPGYRSAKELAQIKKDRLMLKQNEQQDS